MNKQRVVKTWIFYGLKDLLFAFDNDDISFTDNILFSEIMGLEKIIKAVILFEQAAEYENEDLKEAKIAIDKIARNYSHNFKKMLKELTQIGVTKISHLKEKNFDGYLGNDLVRAIEKGYMETRYPVPTPVSESFPIKGTNLKHDPLWSSGITKFIYAVCAVCLEYLSEKMSLEDVWSDFQNSHNHLESLQRFNNSFGNHCGEKSL